MQLWFVSQLNLKHFGEIMRLSDAVKKHLDFPGSSDSKALRAMRFDPWVGKIPWRRKWQPTPYSCLENPMDGGAW